MDPLLGTISCSISLRQSCLARCIARNQASSELPHECQSAFSRRHCHCGFQWICTFNGLALYWHDRQIYFPTTSLCSCKCRQNRYVSLCVCVCDSEFITLDLSTCATVDWLNISVRDVRSKGVFFCVRDVSPAECTINDQSVYSRPLL